MECRRVALWILELVVRTAAHDPGLDLRNGPRVEHRSDSVGGEDIDWLGENARVFGKDVSQLQRSALVSAAETFNRRLVDFGSNDPLHPALEELVYHVTRDVTQSLKSDGLALHAPRTQETQCSFHGHHDARGGQDAGIAAATDLLGNASGIPGPAEDPGHVVGSGAHILGGNVTPAQPGHEAAVVLVDGTSQRGVAVVLAGMTSDDPLAASPPQLRQGALLTHAEAEAEPVANEVLHGAVGPKPYTSRRLPPSRHVNESRKEVPAFLAQLEKAPLMAAVVTVVAFERRFYGVEYGVTRYELSRLGMGDDVSAVQFLRLQGIDEVGGRSFPKVHCPPPMNIKTSIPCVFQSSQQNGSLQISMSLSKSMKLAFALDRIPFETSSDVSTT